MRRVRTLAVGVCLAALGAMGVTAGAASAATVLKVVCTSGCPGSPFSYGPYGASAIGVLQGVMHVQPGVTYDWTFTLSKGGAIQTEMQAGGGAGFTPLQIQYSIWSGTPAAPIADLGTSAFQKGATLSLGGLSPGEYFFQLTPSGVAATGEQLAGSLSDAIIPEPAAWMMMVGGLGLMGAGLRLRRFGRDGRMLQRA